ncbi:MAG TPA: hypothetical protein VHF89_02430 [Solirubrobacteraceae bacterium]|nr:hypothetical protein [Solirubrobacteraceae bacterium]
MGALRETGRRTALLQRSAYLIDEEQAIYKDTEDAPTNGADLAFVESAIFAEYTAFDRLDQLFARFAKALPQRADPQDKWQARNEDLAFQQWLDNLSEEELSKTLGPVWKEREDGRLAPVKAGPHAMSQWLWTLWSFGARLQSDRPKTRLPRAKGTLYVTGPAPEDDKRRAVALGALGIVDKKQGSYDDVAIEYVDVDTASERYEQAAEAGENVLYHVHAGRVFVYVSAIEVRRARAARVTAAGEHYADDFNDLPPEKEPDLEKAFNALPVPQTQAVPGTRIRRHPGKRDQFAAMNKWNALGAAAYAKKTGRRSGLALDQNWEWLHVHAGSAGGPASGGNLAAGLYVSNSLMIPYESMVKSWAREDARHVSFWFIPVNTSPGFAERIELHFEATQHKTLGTLPKTRLIAVDILHGRVVDTLMNEMIKRSIDQTPLSTGEAPEGAAPSSTPAAPGDAASSSSGSAAAGAPRAR